MLSNLGEEGGLGQMRLTPRVRTGRQRLVGKLEDIESKLKKGCSIVVLLGRVVLQYKPSSKPNVRWGQSVKGELREL
jgi:hypothetical protein